jgi:pantoate--beta-alanine ligase
VVTVPSLTQEMEGAHRPGHFDGVATVVAKLFAGTQADRANFGRKDAQQLAVVRAMGRDLSLPIEVRPQPTVREADGLALSSRNVFLTPDDREAALSLSRGLLAAADAVDHGERTASVVEGAAREIMDGTPGVTVEYVTMADQNDVSLPAELARPAFLAVAARVGSVRLIDNVHLDLVDGLIVADRGRRLTATSMLYQEEAADAGGE